MSESRPNTRSIASPTLDGPDEYPLQHDYPPASRSRSPYPYPNRVTRLNRALRSTANIVSDMGDYSQSDRETQTTPRSNRRRYSAVADNDLPPLPSGALATYPSIRSDIHADQSLYGARPSKRVRRSTTTNELTTTREPIKYGYEGQVVPGNLKMEIAWCNGGGLRDQRVPEVLLRHENVLKADQSVYCSAWQNVSMFMRHADHTPFTIDTLHIMAPEYGFDAPVTHGSIYVAMNTDDLKKYQEDAEHNSRSGWITNESGDATEPQYAFPAPAHSTSAGLAVSGHALQDHEAQLRLLEQTRSNRDSSRGSADRSFHGRFPTPIDYLQPPRAMYEQRTSVRDIGMPTDRSWHSRRDNHARHTAASLDYRYGSMPFTASPLPADRLSIAEALRDPEIAESLHLPCTNADEEAEKLSRPKETLNTGHGQTNHADDLLRLRWTQRQANETPLMPENAATLQSYDDDLPPTETASPDVLEYLQQRQRSRRRHGAGLFTHAPTLSEARRDHPASATRDDYGEATQAGAQMHYIHADAAASASQRPVDLRNHHREPSSATESEDEDWQKHCAPLKDPKITYVPFCIEAGKSRVAIKFTPQVSGRFLLIRLRSASGRENVDVQSIIVRGFAGPRFFPASEPC